MAARKAGRPRALGLRFAATLAIDLAAAYDVSDKTAAATAWQALQELDTSKQFKAAMPDVAAVMRAVRDGRTQRVEYSPWLGMEAAKRLPAGTAPRPRK